jgi:hypothetical protein
MVIRILLGILGLFHLGNGAAMLLAPERWYAAVPGVGMTGPMNHHFIQDIGLAYLASGAGLMLGARAGRTAATLARAGAAWPALHALLHIWGWIANGIPRDANAFVSEAIGVVALAALGALLAGLRARNEGVV